MKFLFSFLILISLCLCCCDPAHSVQTDSGEQNGGDFPVLTGPYLGQGAPGTTPVLFAPGIISVAENFEHSAAVFSPDNRTVFWCTNVDFYTDSRIVGNQRLFFMELLNGRWTHPEVTPFTSNIHVSITRPVFSPDGNKLYLEYSSDPNTEADTDIYVAERVDGSWSEPVPVSPFINSSAIERLHWVTPDGSLYFSREPFTDNEEIFVSRWVNGEFQEPEKLGEDYDSEFCEMVILIEPNGEYMLIDQMNAQRTASHLYISYRKGDGSWSDRIRTPYETGGFLALSPDSEYLFFLGDGIFWVSTSFVDNLRPENLE